jgi:hypothetical protein
MTPRRRRLSGREKPVYCFDLEEERRRDECFDKGTEHFDCSLSICLTIEAS